MTVPNVSVFQTERPRNVNAWQAASLLYGDWGTSKVYVIGLAFSLAAYSSFWLILAVSIMNILVGLNYILICKYYPNGGGVYASVRHRSEILALIGAFFLICDYIITMAISALSAFSYLGVQDPVFWAMGTIGLITLLNFFGPRHMGNLALSVALMTVLLVICLAFMSFSHLGTAIANLKPLEGGFQVSWVNFVSVVVALSGVEAIANMTGVMKLNKGSSYADPQVTHTATPAIVAVMLEVSIFTAFFSLALNALPGLVITGDEVSAPGYPNVRDSILRYMGETFCHPLFDQSFCVIFGIFISIVFGVLLLSAINTALIACSSLLFIMARDGQVPNFFSLTNSYGAPKYSIVVAGIAPIIVLFFVQDMLSLASLYAIGFIGAIATNLGSTSTDSSLSLKKHERGFMFFTFLLMVAIEATLFIEKPHARMFVIAVIALGLLLRGLVQEKRARHEAVDLTFVSDTAGRLSKYANGNNLQIAKNLREHIHSLSSKHESGSVEEIHGEHIHQGSILCATNHVSKSVEFALERSKSNNQKLYILFIREQKVLVQKDIDFSWLDDHDACEIFDYALTYSSEPNFVFLYSTSDQPSVNIIEYVKSLQVSCVIMGMSRRSKIINLLRGNIVLQVFKNLPKEIDLIIIS